MADSDIITGKLCPTCGETKPLTEFYFVKATQKPHSYCKKCCGKIAAEFSATHREQENATKQKWRDAHKEERREKRFAKPYPEVYLPIEGKVCRVCKEYKTADQFHKNGRMADGLAHNCKECAKRLTRENYAANIEARRVSSAIYRAIPENREHARERERQRRIENPELVAKGLASLKKFKEENPELARKLANESGKRWRKRNPEKRAQIAKNWGANNIERDRTNKRKYRAANRELYRESNRRWIANNPDKKKAADSVNKHRRRAAEGKFTAADVLAIRKSQNDCCIYCDRNLYGKGQLDHIIPVARGGSNWPSNLQWLCAKCNREKWAMTHEEFVDKLKCDGDPRALKFFFLDAEIIADDE